MRVSFVKFLCDLIFALRKSMAYKFVKNPERFFEDLEKNEIETAEF